ncbi:hypothetical protein N9O40_00150 [Planktomarina sp.]|nr:hypothetical protein [Planktomarina sp.]
MNTSLEIQLEKLELETIDKIENEIEVHFEYENLKRYLEKDLIKYMKKYLKKDFRMGPVFTKIKRDLKNEEQITSSQMDSVIKFIERERPYRRWNRTQIYEYFSPVILPNKDQILVGTLDEFFH